MATTYTHIYDIAQGQGDHKVIGRYEAPLAVAIGPRETDLGIVYTPNGSRTSDNKWPGADHTVIEYNSLAEYRVATAHLTTRYEDAYGEIEGPDVWQHINKVDSLYRA